MIIIPQKYDFRANPSLSAVNELLVGNEQELGLESASVFYEFPLYKDGDDSPIVTPILIISPNHGLVVISSSSVSRNNRAQLEDELEALEKATANITSKLFRNRALRKGVAQLSTPLDAFLYARNLEGLPDEDYFFDITNNQQDFLLRLRQTYDAGVLPPNLVQEAVSTIQGARGLVKPKKRQVHRFSPTSRVAKVNQIESSILEFDRDQEEGFIKCTDGPHRIRGLAGSGKTVILSMKVAQTLLREDSQDLSILYTFSTKSLYQHVNRLIHRFFREFHDDMSYLDCVDVLHAWGGKVNAGVYYNACVAHGVKPLTLTTAGGQTSGLSPFEYACKELLEAADIKPMYDYVFVDEAQDYGKYFLQLCTRLARNNRVTMGADVFQNIFQPKVLTSSDIYDGTLDFDEDTFLRTCYRTPVAVLVAAHSIGLGVYGKQRQIIEDTEAWRSFGYNVLSRDDGKFEENEFIEVERTKETSPNFWSESPQELIQMQDGFNSIEEEAIYIAEKIKHDIEAEGLNPEDILVISLDDRHCNSYFLKIEELLSESQIDGNNTHANKYAIKDFQVEGRVTFSTIHKAKGNEAYSVYLVGCDAVSNPLTLKQRNLIFTAMTRTKGWLHLSAFEDHASDLFTEIKDSISNCPKICFNFPSEEGLQKIQQDLKKKTSDSSMQQKRRQLEKMREELGEQAFDELMSQLDTAGKK